MNRNPSDPTDPQRPAGSTSSGALAFAEAILGELPAHCANGDGSDGIDWEQLEFLASISSEHERKLRDLARAGQVDAREREQLEWLAAISTDHHRQFQDLLREEAAAAGMRERARRCLGNIERLRETWDEDKHPRLGGPPNAGWFASTGGSAAAASPKPSAPKPDALAHPTRQHDPLAQAQPPEYGGQQGSTPGDNRLAQNPQGAAGAQPQAAREIEPVDRGKKVAAASGQVPNAGINVRVYRDMVLATKANGEFERRPDGSRNEIPGVVQIGAYSPVATTMHWVQFFKQSEFDAKGNPVDGGTVADGKSVYHQNGKWHVDMPLPPANGKPDPDAIYYDHKANGNMADNTEKSAVMLDLPTEGTVTPGATRKEVEFKTYLVDDTGPIWEITWTATTTVDAKGEADTTIGEIKGGPVAKFAPALNTRQWNIGNRMIPQGGTKALTSKTTEQATNPFFKN